MIKNKEIILIQILFFIPLNLGNSWASKRKKTLKKKYDKSEIKKWNHWLGEPIKGNELSKKYTELIKSNNKNVLRKYNNFLKCINNSLYFGSVSWCKEYSAKHFVYDWTVNDLFKKSILILTILKTLLDKKIIVHDSIVNIYLDEETDDNLKKNFKEKQLKNFLMQEKNAFSTIKGTEDNSDQEKKNYYNFNLLICQLRDAELKIKNLKYLKSEHSFPIQMADITANLTFKILNKNLTIDETLKYFSSEKTNILTYVFPKFKQFNIVNNEERCCKKC